MNKINLVLLVVIASLIFILIVKLKVYEGFIINSSFSSITLTPMPSQQQIVLIPSTTSPTKTTSISGLPFYNVFEPVIRKYIN